MSFLESIQLDHFYIVLPKEVFEDSKKLISVFPSAQHKKMETKHGAWEGVYLFPANGTLAEFIKEDEDNQVGNIGIAFTTYSLKGDLVESILKAYSEMK